MKVTDKLIKSVTKKANKMIDEKGYFVHIEEWQTRFILEALEKK